MACGPPPLTCVALEQLACNIQKVVSLDSAFGQPLPEELQLLLFEVCASLLGELSYLIRRAFALPHTQGVAAGGTRRHRLLPSCAEYAAARPCYMSHWRPICPLLYLCSVCWRRGS